MRGTRRGTSAVVASVVVAVSSALAACSSSGSAPSDNANAPLATITVDSSANCPASATIAPGADETLEFGGLARRYKVWLPTGYDGTKPVPLILNYHGTGGSPDAIEAFTGLAAKGNARGYLVVAPQAEKGDRGSTTGWTVPGIGTTPDDVAFTNALIDSLAKRICIDPERVYATGFSSGGAFSAFLACTDGQRFAGVAPGGGVSLVNPASNAFCKRDPVPVYAFHGTDDPFVSYQGLGTPVDPSLPADRPFFGDVQATMAAVAAKNGCDSKFDDQQLASDVTLRIWNACTADTRILIVDGGGHTFPGSAVSAAQSADRGRTTRSVDMAMLLLDWFDTQRGSSSSG